MAVGIERIKPGAAFQFATAVRRVTSIGAQVGSGFMVNWEYADGRKRGGKLSGSQWVHYFRKDAIEELPDAGSSAPMRTLRPNGRMVPCLSEPTAVTLNTACPAKWVMVDLETGDLWGHNGTSFKRADPVMVAELVAVASAAVDRT